MEEEAGKRGMGGRSAVGGDIGDDGDELGAHGGAEAGIGHDELIEVGGASGAELPHGSADEGVVFRGERVAEGSERAVDILLGGVLEGAELLDELKEGEGSGFEVERQGGEACGIGGEGAPEPGEGFG